MQEGRSPAPSGFADVSFHPSALYWQAENITNASVNTKPTWISFNRDHTIDPDLDSLINFAYMSINDYPEYLTAPTSQALDRQQGINISSSQVFMSSKLLDVIFQNTGQAVTRTIQQDLEAFGWVLVFAIYVYALRSWPAYEPEVEGTMNETRDRIEAEYRALFGASTVNVIRNNRWEAFFSNSQDKYSAITNLLDYSMPNPEVDSPVGAILQNVWKCLRMVQSKTDRPSTPDISKWNKRVGEIIDTHIAPAYEDWEVDVIESLKAVGITDEAVVLQVLEHRRQSREAGLSHKAYLDLLKEVRQKLGDKAVAQSEEAHGK